MISRFVHDPPYIKNAKVGAFDNIGFGLLVVWTGCLQVVLDKGQEDDWFGALWVRWAVAALVVGADRLGLALLVKPRGPCRSARAQKPQSSGRGVSSLPCWACASTSPSPFCRSIIRKSSVTPRLPPGWWWARGASDRSSARRSSEYLGTHFDNRKLLCGGFIGFGICSLYFGTVNLAIGPFTLLVPILITGFALSFVFVPLANLSTSTLSREEMGNATGLFNMLRNIGGSIGIAMATTALDPPRRPAPERPRRPAFALQSRPAAESRRRSPAILPTASAPARPVPAPSACSTG